MLQISKNSWHYRWLVKFGSTPWKATTLCEYLSKLLMSLLVTAVIAVFACVLLWVVGVALYALVITPIMYFVGYQPSWITAERFAENVHFVKVLWIAIAFCGAFIATLFTYFEYGSRLKAPGIVKTAWTDFKEKTCTRITFK